MKNKTILSLLLPLLFLQAKGQSTPEKAKANFKADISYLASDNLQGRLAGSEYDKLSAEYIAKEFEKAGLKSLPGGAFQTFDVVRIRIANKCIFSIRFGEGTQPVVLELHRDYYPISESGNNDSAYAEPIYLGYGIEAPKENHNDYANAATVKGKIAMIRLGFPMDDTLPHSKLADYGEISQKIQLAIKYGAVGIVFLPGTHATTTPSGELQRNMSGFNIPIFYSKKELIVQPLMKIFLKAGIATITGKAHNVIGYRNNKAKNTVIICAHHDHLGHNEYNNSLYKGPNAVHNGADDNASGVAAMLELARTLKGKKYKANNYLFVAFSGEEMGLLGSKYFVKNASVDLGKINYVINLDMLGRMDSVSHVLLVNGTGTSPQWNASIAKLKLDTNSVKIVQSESGLGPSDHASFYMENIPVLHFFTGQHSDYHKPSDDENKINYDGLYTSYSVIVQIIASTKKSGKIVFTKTKDTQPGRRSFKITLGVMPDYTFTGHGMRLDGVSEGKPAFNAGMLRGDIILKMGEFPINNLQDYMQALSHFESGQKINVEVLRGTENKIFAVEL